MIKHSFCRICLMLLITICCLGIFCYAFSLLPQSAMPLWLVLVITACAALGAGFRLLVSGTAVRQNNFSHWPLRLLILGCAGILLMLSCELFLFNHRSFVTRNCETRDVELYTLTDRNGNYLSDGEPILIIPSDNNRFTVQTEELLESAIALRVVLSGSTTPVEMMIELMDEANAYTYVNAGNGVLVPSVKNLDTFDCALYTNGDMNALRLTFALDNRIDASVYIESIQLDPCVPVVWKPLRMVFCFFVIWFALCMLCFPWKRVVYQPKRFLHRAILLSPMVFLIVFYSYLTPHAMLHWKPEGANELFWIWRPYAEAATSTIDGYGIQFNAFLHGQLHLLQEPSDDLLSLNNPYDMSERYEYDVDFLHDFAMFEEKYYLYFGIGPILLFYYPYYLLTAQMPSFILVCMLSAMLAVCMTFWAVTGFVRRYIRQPNLFLLTLVCTTAALMAAGPFLATSPSRYENVISLNIAMMAGAVGFGYHAVMQSNHRRRIVQFILCGLCFALQSMCRANTLLITTVFLAPAFISVLGSAQKLRSKVRDALCFLLPAIAGVGFVMLYNYLRFGSVAEFGQLHQITNEDIHYNVFRPEYIPQALYYFLLDLPSFSLPFPYVHASTNFLNITGNYFFTEPNVGIFSYPLAWLVLFMPSAWRRMKCRSLLVENAWCVLLALAAALGLMVVSFYYAGVNQRYTYDFLLLFALLAAFVGLKLAEESDTAGSVLTLLCLFSSLLGMLFGFSNVRNMILLHDPVWYISLVRSFFPY